MAETAFQVNMYEIHQGRCRELALSDARARNEAGADVYWTPNNFDGHHRKKEDLRQITSFFCEIDDGDKATQMNRLHGYLPPSCIIETKRGHHVYWYLDQPIDCSSDPVGRADWFRSIVAGRICQALRADTQAADACRLLRMPMYRYWKDGLGQFIVDISLETGRRYALDEILRAFPEPKQREPAPDAPQSPPRRDLPPPLSTDGFWTKANTLDCRAALEKLSGSSHVSCERFTFRKQRDGTTRIDIDGKPRNAWIDRDGKIGSVAGGGPSIPNWLFYYHKDMKRVADIIKTVWPELGESKS